MTEPQHFELPGCECLSCHKTVDCGTGSQRPSPGDITVCFYCGHIMAFNDAMTLRGLTSQEMYDVAGNAQILAIQQLRELAKEMGFKPGES